MKTNWGWSDEANIASFVVNSDFIVSVWGDKITKLSGLPSEEVVGQPLAHLFSLSAASNTVSTLKASALTQMGLQQNFLLRLCRREGTELRLLASCTLRPGQQESYLIAGLEIPQDLHLVEDAASAAAGQQVGGQTPQLATAAALLEGADVAMFCTDLNGLVVTWNGCMEELTGHTAEEVVSKSSLTDLISWEQRGSMQSAQKRVVLGGEASVDLSLSLQKTSTGSPPLVLSCRALRDQRRRVVGVCYTAKTTGSYRLLEERSASCMQQFRWVVGHVAGLVWAVDKGLHVLEWSPQLEEVTGVAAADAIGKRLGDLLLLGDGQKAWDLCRLLQRIFLGDTLGQDKSFQVEFQSRCDPSQSVKLNATSVRMFDEAGAVERLLCVAKTLNEAMPSDAGTSALLNTLSNIQSALHVANTPFLSVDAEGHVEGCNEEFANLLKLSQSEIQGKSLKTLVLGEECASASVNCKCLMEMDEVLEGHENSFVEFLTQHSNGERIEIPLHLIPRIGSDRRVAGFYGVGSRHAESNEDVLGSNCRKLIELAEKPIFCTDIEGTVTQWNECCRKYTELQTEDVVGKKLAVVLVHADQQEMLQYVVDGVLSGETLEKIEISVRAKGREFMDIQFNLGPLVNNSGAISGIIGVILEGSSSGSGGGGESARELEAKCQKMELEVEGAMKAVEVQSDFLAEISHEIRAPLNDIMGMIQLLAETDMKDNQQKYVALLQLSCDNVLFLVNDILDLKRIQSGSITLENIEFNVIQTVEDAVFPLAAASQNHKDLEVFCTFDPGMHEQVIGDPHRLKQIITNLITNSVKFTHQGTVHIKVCLASWTRETVDLKVVVEDTGIGIPEDSFNTLFHRFIQAETSTYRNFGGSGLGLSIANNLVSLMGGSLQVESQVGIGTKFTFIVTLARKMSDSNNLLALSPPERSQAPLLEPRPQPDLNPADPKAWLQWGTLAGMDSERAEEESFSRPGAPSTSREAMGGGREGVAKSSGPALSSLLLNQLAAETNTSEAEVTVNDREVKGRSLSFTSTIFSNSNGSSLLDDPMEWKQQCGSPVRSREGDAFSILLVVENKSYRRHMMSLLTKLNPSMVMTESTISSACTHLHTCEHRYFIGVWNVCQENILELTMVYNTYSEHVKHWIVLCPMNLLDSCSGNWSVISKPFRDSEFCNRIKDLLSQPEILRFSNARKCSVDSDFSSQPESSGGDSRDMESKSNGSVLVVDDSAVSQFYMVNILESAGYDVDVAGNGQEAVDALKCMKYDVCLMDVHMPVMDGFDAVKLIREREKENKLPPLPIVSVSAGCKMDKLNCFQCGSSDFMSKPVHTEKLLATVEMWVAESQKGAKQRRHSERSSSTRSTTMSSSTKSRRRSSNSSMNTISGRVDPHRSSFESRRSDHTLSSTRSSSLHESEGKPTSSSYPVASLMCTRARRPSDDTAGSKDLEAIQARLDSLGDTVHVNRQHTRHREKNVEYPHTGDAAIASTSKPVHAEARINERKKTTILMVEDPQFDELALSTLLGRISVTVIPVSTQEYDPLESILENLEVIDAVMMVLNQPVEENEEHTLQKLHSLATLTKEEKPVLLGLVSLTQELSTFWKTKYIDAGFVEMTHKNLKPGGFMKFMRTYFLL